MKEHDFDEALDSFNRGIFCYADRDAIKYALTLAKKMQDDGNHPSPDKIVIDRGDDTSLAEMVLAIDKAARDEGLYIGGGYNHRLSKDEQEGPMWKAIKKKAAALIAAQESGE